MLYWEQNHVELEPGYADSASCEQKSNGVEDKPAGNSPTGCLGVSYNAGTAKPVINCDAAAFSSIKELAIGATDSS